MHGTSAEYRAWRAAVLADTPVDQQHRVNISFQRYQDEMRAQDAQDAELAELRQIKALASKVVRLDSEKHHAMVTGTGRDLQTAAHEYVVAWEALKAAVTPPRSDFASAMGSAVAASGGAR